MKRKFWSVSRSIASSRMTIRSSLPWPVKVMLVVVCLGLAGAFAMWAYEAGRNLTGFNPDESKLQLTKLRTQVEKLTGERDLLATASIAADSKLNIERSAQKQLARQAKTLEQEIIKLKEDLAFFESLLPADTGPGGIAIRRLKAEPIGSNQLRYRILLMQGGKGARDFSGNLQVAVSGLQGGKNVIIVFPEAKSADADKFRLGFKHYQRMEGILTLPEGLSVKSVQARVLEKGQLRTQLSANL